MPELIIPNAAMATAVGRYHEQVWVNVYGVIIGGGPLQEAEAESIEVDFRSYYSTQQQHRSERWSYERFEIRDLNSPTAPAYEFPVNVVGTAEGDDLSPGAALCISLKTNLRGRSFRGRSFHNGWQEATNGLNGQPTPAILQNVQDDFESLVAQLAANETPLAVLSRTLSVATEVTHITIQQRWANLRGRNYLST